jgi:hypothetical protein
MEGEGNLNFDFSDFRDESGGEVKGGVEETQAQDWNLNSDWKLKGKWKSGGDGAAGLVGGNADREFLKSDCRNSSSQADADANSKADANLYSSANSTANSKTPVNRNSNANLNANLNARSNANALNRVDLNAGADSRVDLDSSVGCSGHVNTCAASNARGCASGNSRQGLTAIGEVKLGFVAATGDANRDWRAQSRVFGMSAKELALEKELRVGQGPVCGPRGVRPEVLERIRLRDAARAKIGTRSP